MRFIRVHKIDVIKTGLIAICKNSDVEFYDNPFHFSNVIVCLGWPTHSAHSRPATTAIANIFTGTLILPESKNFNQNKIT